MEKKRLIRVETDYEPNEFEGVLGNVFCKVFSKRVKCIRSVLLGG